MELDFTENWKLFNGDAEEVLKTIDDNSVDCVVTSPPYYALRDYGTGRWIGGDENCNHSQAKMSTRFERKMTEKSKKQTTSQGTDVKRYKAVCPHCGAVRVDEQIGLEDSPEAYIERLVGVFREVKRVLKPTGTCWINIGDSYWGSGSRGFDFTDTFTEKSKIQMDSKGTVNLSNVPSLKGKVGEYKDKDLIGIPWMLAFALRKDGWYLRQDIVWCLSGGTNLYVKSQKGVQPMMLKDMVRLDPKTVQLWNGERWVNVLGWVESNDTSEKLEIVLRSGETIGCTGKHKWVLADGAEKTASELKVGDVLMTTTFEDCGTHTPSVLTSEILWLIGLYLAEGSHSNDTIQLSLCSDEEKWLKQIANAIEQVGGTMTHTTNGGSLSVRLYSKVFNAILSQYVGGRTSKDKHLNNICWQLPNESIAKILKGYFDGDGHYDGERVRLGFTRNYALERDLRLAAARLGATLTLKKTFSFSNGKKYPSFKGEWRWNAAEHFNRKDRAEITEIRKGRARHYYDVSVDCDNHLFALSSGVLTHNCKTNPMPESIKDRCTKSHEYIFLLTKSPKYFFDNTAIQEEAAYAFDNRGDRTDNRRGTYMNSVSGNTGEFRNKRDVWSVPASVGYSDGGAHYATYNPKLIEPCVLAGCPAGGIVLDPFNGTGTTGVVALKASRKYVGIDLNAEYIAMSTRRLEKESAQYCLFDLFNQ